ncbi:MAG: hypothetical protein KDA75_21290 [Planctomycetaceae bacterium]|nr:hypothetical protein [Planctomycetaceae bacterium]
MLSHLQPAQRVDEQVQRPPLPSLRWCAAAKRDQLHFGRTIERRRDPTVDADFSFQRRRQSVLKELQPYPLDLLPYHPDGFPDVHVGTPAIRMALIRQQEKRMGVSGSRETRVNLAPENGLTIGTW